MAIAEPKKRNENSTPENVRNGQSFTRVGGKKHRQVISFRVIPHMIDLSFKITLALTFAPCSRH